MNFQSWEQLLKLVSSSTFKVENICTCFQMYSEDCDGDVPVMACSSGIWTLSELIMMTSWQIIMMSCVFGQFRDDVIKLVKYHHDVVMCHEKLSWLLNIIMTLSYKFSWRHVKISWRHKKKSWQCHDYIVFSWKLLLSWNFFMASWWFWQFFTMSEKFTWYLHDIY